MSQYIDESKNNPDHIERINRIAEKMLDSDNQAIMRGWQEDLKSLEDSEKDDLAIITEEQFVRVFLPFFAQDEVNVYNVSISNWLTIAGSPANAAFKRVKVVDPNSGEVLFTVPPIYDNNAFKVVAHDRQDAIGEIVGETLNMAHISPRKSRQYFRERLVSLLKESSPDNVSIVEYIKEWNAIFSRYNRPLIDLGLEETKDQSDSGNNKDNTDSSKDYDYEPL